MKYHIEKNEHTPAYLQLYRQVREDIIREIYPYGTKLPSKRTVAEETAISVVTVEHAYALLCDEGYIEPRERSGYYVSFRTDDGFAAAQHTPLTAPTPHRSGEAAEFPFSVLAKTMRAVIGERGETILDRSPNLGCIELREAICRYLARSRGILAEPRQIVIGSGSEYLYSLLVELLGRDRIYAIEAPSYKQIEHVYRASDVTCRHLPLGKNGMDSTALWATDASVLHLSPYRSFPSGVTADASKRHEYLRWAATDGRYLVEDDFESEFSLSKKAEETLFSHTDTNNVIYMNTFSKTVSPSLRVGYMVLPAPLAGIYEERLGFYSCTVPTFIQIVLATLINSGDFERHINRVRRRKRRELEH